MSYNPSKAPHRYRGIDTAVATIHDSTSIHNVLGKRFIRVGGAGTVKFRHIDGSFSAVMSFAANELFELGAELDSIVDADTTATDIVTFY